jgi:TolB protein
VPLAGLNGTLVFQTKVGGDIYVYDLDTGELRWLTKGYDPEISPDGTEVAFTRYDSQPGIWSIGIDGSDERFLFGERELITSPKWSPDGEWIVFSRAGSGYQCYDFGFGICISEGQVCPPFLPGCLPSERRVTKPDWRISRVDSDGEQYRDLASLTSARAPDWHEYGIVYGSATGIEITEDTPEGDTRNVIAERYYQDPDWQPGGDRIAFQSREGDHHEIFTVNTDGTGLQALTQPVTTLVDSLPSNVSPAWSPDGNYIAFLSSRQDDGDQGPWRIWVMRGDGSGQQPLPIDVPIEYGFGDEQMISWGN